MRKLTDYQFRFILVNFFKKEEGIAWRIIACNLLEYGRAIYAGEKCVWDGGIGNFIRTEKAEGYHGCLLYSFDLESFLKSEYFLTERSIFVSQAVTRLKEFKPNPINEFIIQEFKDIDEL